MIAFACEFEQYEPLHVKCVHCNRKLSGIPEDYSGRYVCPQIGPGAEIAKKIETWVQILPWSSKYKFSSCGHCHELRITMNRKGREWCRKNRRLIARIIKENARRNRIFVPLCVIKLLLRTIESDTTTGNSPPVTT